MGNTNNINETRSPGAEGDWKPERNTKGLRSARQAGMQWAYESKDRRLSNRLEASAEYANTDNETQEQVETFADNGNIFNDNRSKSITRLTTLELKDNFSTQRPYVFGNLQFMFDNRKISSTSSSETYRDYVINRSDQASHNARRSYAWNTHLSHYVEMPWGDDALTFSMYFSRTRTLPAHTFSRTLVQYADADDDLRHRYTRYASSAYMLTPSVSYTYALPHRQRITLGLQYEQACHSVHNSNYRLDRIPDADTLELTALPSTIDALEAVLDGNNSSNYVSFSRLYSVQLRYNLSHEHHQLGLSLGLTRERERISYHTEGLDTLAWRSRYQVAPSINYRGDVGGGTLTANFYGYLKPVEFCTLMSYVNNSSSLATYINNPRLRDSYLHSVEMAWDFKEKTLRRNLSFRLKARA